MRERERERERERDKERMTGGETHGTSDLVLVHGEQADTILSPVRALMAGVLHNDLQSA